VSIVVARVKPVGVHSREVLNLEFDQALGELLSVAQAHGKSVSLKLKPS